MLKTVILDRRTLGEDLDVTIDFDTSVTAYPITQPHEAAQRIADADVVFVNKVRLDEENLKNAKNLKLICEAATGYDNIDTDYCRKAGIAVCNVPGYSSHSVPQVTVGAVLYLANRLKQYTDFTASGEYSKSGTANCLTPVFHEVCGKTWGIAGVGGIGSEVAKAAEALGCKVIAFKRTPSDKFDCVDIDTLVEKSDIISVHLPLCDETRGIINAERIAKMKKDVIFANTARGAVADEAALCRALKEGKIGGLAADVYSSEPFLKDSPYYEIKNHPNVCLTPHMAWGAAEARRRCFDEMVKNMKAYFAGEIRNRVEAL